MTPNRGIRRTLARNWIGLCAASNLAINLVVNERLRSS